MTRTLALIPARAGSKRVPGKNVRPFLGKPLIQWTLEFANHYPLFDDVLISTDCERVAAIAAELGSPLPWMRPSELASDQAGTMDVVLHALDAMEQKGRRFDRLALLQPTTPMRHAARWNEAFELLDRGCSAVVGVSPVEKHPYWTYLLDSDGTMRACFPDQRGLRSQELPTAVAVNGALYLIDVNTLRERKSFTPDGVKPVVFTDPLETIDIDTENDWVAAEAMLTNAMRLK
jgi:CMP-N-acetylneuraminic acid synthetase